MPFFAVVDKRADARLKVRECHLNLWCLQGLADRVFLFDVGLRLYVEGNGSVSEFQVALPFQSREIEDITDKLGNPAVAALVFGNVNMISHPIIAYENSRGRHQLSLCAIDTAKSKYDQDYSSDNYSCWTVILANPIRTGQEYYTRFRFPVESCGQIWRWRRAWFTRHGAVFDFRISDPRGAPMNEKWRAFQDRFV